MKLIAIDMDGTLLNKEGEISVENIRAIDEAIQQGTQVVIVTGRPLASAEEPLRDAGLSLPIICLNGAQSYTVDKELVDHIPIEARVSEQILSVLHAHELYTEIFTTEGAYSDGNVGEIHQMMLDENAHMARDSMIQRSQKRLVEEGIQFVNDYASVLLPSNDLYKVQAFSSNAEVLRKVRTQLDIANIVVSSSGKINIEINHEDAQKGKALTLYADALGIMLEDVMAIGDNLNDLSMLEIVGHPVAMGNAHETIKRVASYETETNDAAGVAHIINEIILRKKTSMK